MKFVTEQEIPCLDDDDYAAVALYMKCLGLQVEERVSQVQSSVDDFTHRPVSVWERDGSVSLTGVVSGALLFRQNWPVVSSAEGIANIRGWWHIGVNMHIQAQGTVDVNTRRIALLRAVSVLDPQLTYITYSDKVWESNTGNGENLVCGGVFFFPGIDAPETVLGADLTTHVESGNTSSDVDILPALSRLWTFYLGETPQIEQVT